ncbi:hypothetical protein B0H11DRAFT_2335778, partial [Mycena galericulata]
SATWHSVPRFAPHSRRPSLRRTPFASRRLHAIIRSCLVAFARFHGYRRSAAHPPSFPPIAAVALPAVRSQLPSPPAPFMPRFGPAYFFAPVARTRLPDRAYSIVLLAPLLCPSWHPASPPPLPPRRPPPAPRRPKRRPRTMSRCPARCPAAPARCPDAPARCPAAPARCPDAPARCPAASARCPAPPPVAPARHPLSVLAVPSWSPCHAASFRLLRSLHWSDAPAALLVLAAPPSSCCITLVVSIQINNIFLFSSQCGIYR